MADWLDVDLSTKMSIHGYVLRGLFADAFCVSRNATGADSRISLRCDVANEAQPPALRTWLKDGELVYSELDGDSIDSDEYSIENQILLPGVLDPVTFTTFGDGSIAYNYDVMNISVPAFVPEGVTTPQQARDVVFDLLLGNWTCVLNSSLGSPDPITYLIRECGKKVMPLLK